MTTFFDRLKILFQRRDPTIPDSLPAQPDREARSPGLQGTAVTLDEASLSSLLQQILFTSEGEYTCAETADLLDEYVDLVADHKDAEHLLPFVKHHLDHCVGCSERYQALLQIVEADH